jgi:hypothetical protein
MKTKLQAILITVLLFSLPVINYGQTPDLKTCADFILFTSSGGITNTGVSQILGGAIGTNAGALTGFDDVNCVKHIANAETAQCKLDLQAVYDEITAIVPTATITAASLNGGTITPGIYQINSAVALTINLTLDAQNNPNALFIFKVIGAIDAAASVSILLTNGASVNNIFWHGTAAIGAGAGASLKGTFMTNAGAVSLGAGAMLEGRALTVIGEVTMSGSTLTGCLMPEATTVTLTQPTFDVATGTIEVTAPLGAGITYSIDGIDFTNTTGMFSLLPGGEYTVTSKNSDGCISWIDVVLVSYVHKPDLKTCADFILFTSSGSITNTGVSQILGGAIGTNFGALVGFENVNCVKHIQNGVTAQCKLDLQAVYDEITAIVPTATITAASLDGATITPGIYKINEAVALSINLTLDAQNNPDALFIFKIVGAFSTAASVNILLINGASVNNIFWHGTAAIGSGASASLKGTFMTNAGAIAFGAGTLLEGRALTVIGEVTISGSTLTGCINPVATTVTLTQPTCSVFTGTIEVTAPLGAGMTYSIDGTDFTNSTGLFTKVPAGDYTVTSKNADGCLSMTDITLVGFKHPPSLGTLTDFVLFTSIGAVGNTGISTITGGAIGTNAGAISGFDAIDCVKHVENAETAQATIDLQAAFDELGAIQTTETITAASLSGATLTAGVYHINSAANLTANLTLNAQGNPDAIFIFKVTGAFSVAALVDILLINGANVNNVFWRVDGAISAGAGATLRGVFIALAGEVALGDGADLEGRAMTIAGAVSIYNSEISVCIRPVDPVITLTQPNCSLNTGSITITTPIAADMTYRIDYCAYSNTSGKFTDVAPGTYLVTAKDSDGCISDGTTVIINAESPDITWTGIASNDWNNIGNWNLAEIPGAYCDAIIPINAVVNISAETPAKSKGLSLGAGAVLTIESGKTLTVYGTLTNNAGVAGLIMKSDAGGTASLIHNTANVPATFERYMNDADWADWRDGWHFVSSPVALQAISPSFTVDPASDYDFYSWYEPSNLWVNFKNNINPPTWSTANTINNGLVNTSSNLLAGKGYMVAYNAADVKVFSGNLNVANLTVQDLTITGTSNASRSWYLLGNPFSSALTWDASSAWNFTNIAGVAKIWNEALQAYSDLTSTPASSIPATNGFMVQASTGTGSLTLPAAKREHSAQAFYKNTVSIPRIVLLASPNDKSSGQHSTICFIPEATEDFDLMYDSEFLAGYAPKFYSISDDFKLSTNSLPSLNDEIVIPFGFVKNYASGYSIELLKTIQGQTLYLSDLKTNAVHIFNDNPVYHFNSEEGDDPNRFLLYFGTVSIGNQADAENFRTYFSGGNLYMMIPDGKAVLEVFDILGRMVQRKTIFGEGLHSQPFNQPPGLYIVRLLGENGAKTVKIIVD